MTKSTLPRLLLKELIAAIRRSGDYETSQGRLRKRPKKLHADKSPCLRRCRETMRGIVLPTLAYEIRIAAYIAVFMTIEPVDVGRHRWSFRREAVKVLLPAR
jgi:hypothetical protein